MTPKRLRYPLLRALATGAMASLAVLAACEAKLPTSDEVDNMTALSATAVAGKMALIDTARVTYYVDGVPVSLAEAEKIDAEHIATVNVVQKGMQSGGEVRITTILSDSGFAKASGDSGPKRITYNRTDANTPSEGTGRVRVTLKAPDGSQTAYTGTGQLVNSGADFAIIRMDTTDKKLAEVRPRTNFSGLVIIDGAMSDMNAMSRLAPDQIASVNVIKGAAARQQYHDPRAVDGVIEITTKKAVKP